MEVSKGVIGAEVGILTHILSKIPNASKVVKWPEASGNATMYKVLNNDNKVSYIIKQYDKLKVPDGMDIKERAMKEKDISDILCPKTPYVGQVLNVKTKERPMKVRGPKYDFVII